MLLSSLQEHCEDSRFGFSAFASISKLVRVTIKGLSVSQASVGKYLFMRFGTLCDISK
jgi:hypothetical protein